MTTILESPPRVHASTDEPPDYSDKPFNKLPFIAPGSKCQWLPPPSLDYQSSCVKGREHAAHFAQFLKDNPLASGGNSLARLVRSIDFKDSQQQGYWLGFFSYLELLILDGALNRPVFADLRAYEAGQGRAHESRAL